MTNIKKTEFLLNSLKILKPKLYKKMIHTGRLFEFLIEKKHLSEKEIKDYCKTQKDRAANLLGQIEGKLSRSLINGEFIFGGNATAVEGYDQKLLDACKKHLLDAAKQVFDRYQEAPVQVNTNVAEKFIRADNLSL